MFYSPSVSLRALAFGEIFQYIVDLLQFDRLVQLFVPIFMKHVGVKFGYPKLVLNIHIASTSICLLKVCNCCMLNLQKGVNLTVIGILNFLNGIYLPSIVCIPVQKLCISIHLL